jgi:hypothetical protein
MSTPDEILSEYDLFARRLKKRYIIDQDVLIYFAGHVGIYSCLVRDATDEGVGLRPNGLATVPSEFDVSFDNFRATHRCQLIWRDGDLAGAAFKVNRRIVSS